MRRRVLILTGKPRVGKTTLVLEIVERLKASGLKAGGMISKEVRGEGRRVGFEIINVSTGTHGWLAQVSQVSGPQVGRYRVNLDDLKLVGAQAILEATLNAEVIVIDEVGPMELFSEDFKKAAQGAFESNKPVLAVVHRSQVHKYQSVASKVYEVTLENRDELVDLLVSELTAKA